MLDKNVNSLELRLRIIESEIREGEREIEKSLDGVLGCSFMSILFSGGSVYLFFNPQQVSKETYLISFLGLIVLSVVSIAFIPYWYNKYKKKKNLKNLKRNWQG